MSFHNKVVVITGGAHGIGKATGEAFKKAGAHVAIIDIAPGSHFVGDVGDKETLERFAGGLIEECGRIDVLVNNALPPMIGLEQASFEDFQKALTIGVTAPFYLSKLFAPTLRKMLASSIYLPRDLLKVNRRRSLTLQLKVALPL